MTKEEAIKELRGFIGQLTEGCQEAIKVLIPELKESEDEIHRKWILEYLYEGLRESDEQFKEQFKSAIDWLEKQREPKSISAEGVLVRAGLKPYKDGNQWCVLAGDNIQEGICGFGNTIEDALYEFLKEILDLQKERKPAEWSEEDNKIIYDAYLWLCEYAGSLTQKNQEKSSMLYKTANRLKSLRPQPKNEWSEEDEKKRNWFPNIKWETEPVEVEVTIRRK